MHAPKQTHTNAQESDREVERAVKRGFNYKVLLSYFSVLKLKTEAPHELPHISLTTSYQATQRRCLLRALSVPTSVKQFRPLPKPVSWPKRPRAPHVECWALMRLLGRKRPRNWLFLLYKHFPPRAAVSLLVSLLSCRGSGLRWCQLPVSSRSLQVCCALPVKRDGRWGENTDGSLWRE